MRVTIVGCGSLGGLMARRLADSGCPIQIFQRGGATLEALRSSGIAFEEGGIVTRLSVRAEDDPDRLEKADLSIIAVKAFDTGAVASALPGLMKPEGLVLTVQNGLGNGEKLASVLGGERVAVGACTYGAYRDESGILHLGGDGEILFGPIKAGENWKAVETLLRESGLAARLVEDPILAVWKKLIVNAGINPVAALIRSENGGILSCRDTEDLCRSLVEEACLVANDGGIPLDAGDMWLKVRSVIRGTAGNRCSMLQDVLSGRDTEIDAISGEILRLGRIRGRNLPRTGTVCSLIRGMKRS